MQNKNINVLNEFLFAFYGWYLIQWKLLRCIKQKIYYDLERNLILLEFKGKENVPNYLYAKVSIVGCERENEIDLKHKNSFFFFNSILTQ